MALLWEEAEGKKHDSYETLYKNKNKGLCQTILIVN